MPPCSATEVGSIHRDRRQAITDRLLELDVPGDSLLLLGGGARSRLWTQMRADLTGLPVLVADRVDTCPVGAAMLGAVAGGLQPDLQRCVDLVVGQSLTLTPRRDVHDAYQDAYSSYRKLFASLRSLW